LNEPLLTVADVGDASGGDGAGEGEFVGLEVGDGDGERT
jgi:hypothetical protein